MPATVEVRDMRDAETTLAIVQDRGKRGLPLEDVYRRLYNTDLYLRAYGRIYRNAGAMTKGSTDETVDGMSLAKIEAIIELLRHERYRWTPARRVLIPKTNGKTRPLGIPIWSDKLLQEVMRSILEAYYEPQFSDHSHGFRPERGCHTALRQIYCTWTGVTWLIEGDIKGCFDNIDHTILLSILREKIFDNRFLGLITNLLQAGYLEQWTYRPTLSGTPQGGIISPLLANIYMDRLDSFVAQTLNPKFTAGKARRQNPESARIRSHIRRLRSKGVTEADLAPFNDRINAIASTDPNDPGFRRLKYIRYADDFLLGFIGPRNEAEEIKVTLEEFLRDKLRLTLSPEKTLITNAVSEKARFLGYDISRYQSQNPARIKGNITLRLPPEKLKEKVARYTKDGKPIHRSILMHDTDFSIVTTYGLEYRGIVNYYGFAHNRFWLWDLYWVMRMSLLKTLAAKHKTTVTAMARKYTSEILVNGKPLKCITVTVNREGKEPLVARFGGIRLTPDPTLVIEAMDDVGPKLQPSQNELLARILAEECELCGFRHNIVVHHIRALKDLIVRGQKERPHWLKVMAARRRKTLVVCVECHAAIHAGRPTRIKESS